MKTSLFTVSFAGFWGQHRLTLDEAIDRIDPWYKAHPDQLDTTVIEVIWLDRVRPNLPASRRYDEDAKSEGKR